MKKGRVLKVLAGVVLIVFAGVWIEASRLGLTSAHERYLTQVAAAKKEGLPFTEADLKLPAIPDGENAAQIILNTDTVIKTLPGNPDSVLNSYSTKPPTGAQVDRALADMKPVLDMAKEAANRPHLDFHWHYQSEMDLRKGLYETKRLIKLLARKANRAVQKGDIVTSLDCLQTAARLCRHLSEPPDMLAILVRINSEKMVLAALANSLRKARTPAVLASLRETLALLGGLPDLRAGLKCEFEMEQGSIGGMADADQYASCGPLDCDYVPPEWKLMRIGQVEDINRANHIDLSRRRIAATPVDINLLNRSREASARAEEDSDHDGIAYMAVNAFFPQESQLRDSVLENVAARRVFAAALDISSLPKLPAAWAKPGYDGIDPLTDRPLTYRRTKSGFVVYSFGKDRKDDGGLPLSFTQRSDGYDISFEYPKLSVRSPTPPRAIGPPGGPPRSSADKGD